MVTGREGGIRTRDLPVPNRARYQASLLPETHFDSWDIAFDPGSPLLPNRVLHSTEHRPFATFVKTSVAEGRQILTVDRSFHYLHGRELKSNARAGEVPQIGWAWTKKG